MSAPLALVNSISPSVFADATISPIEALFIAVIVSAALVTLEKLIVFPFMLMFEAAVEASDTLTSSVTILLPEAVTLVDEETALIAMAFAAADALSDAPISTSLIFILCFSLYTVTGDFLQWVAWGIGTYLVCTWIQSLNYRDIVAFTLMFRSKAILYSFISFPCIPFVGYAYSAFTPSFYINYHGMTALEIGTLVGLLTAIGSFIGVIGGGFIGDKLRDKYVGGRLYVICVGGVLITAIGCLGMIYSESRNISIAFNFFYHIGSAVYVGCAATTVTNLVLPRMRAMAGAFFILTLSMIGLALGPYTLGRISDLFESQGYAAGEAMQTSMGLILFILIIPSITLFLAVKHLKADEESVLERARALGENI